MNRLSNRLDALEQSMAPERMHCIRQFEGQSREKALAAYEAENGPVGPDDRSTLYVFIHKPFPAA